MDEDDEVTKLPPMFITEFILDTVQLTFQPDEEEFQDKLAEVIKQFQVKMLLFKCIREPKFYCHS